MTLRNIHSLNLLHLVWSLAFIICCLTSTVSGYAHNGKEHADSSRSQTPVMATSNETPPGDQQQHESEGHGHQSEGAAAIPYATDFPMLEQLPTWHPLVVHLPVVLLPLALVFGLIGLWRRDIAWRAAILLCLLGGLAGALAASYWLHPHTVGLPEEISHILHEHENYADWTVWLSVGAALTALGSYVLASQRRVLEIFTVILLVGATVAVTLAGHHGAIMVYQQGVGARGAFIEAH